jgi:transcriptional regulator with GAF, ATPase, and Fis domain
MEIGSSFYLSMYKTITTVKDPEKLTGAIFKNLQDVMKFKAGGMALLNKDRSYFDFYIGELSNIEDSSGSVSYNRVDVSLLPFNFDIKNPQLLIVDIDKKFINSCEKIGNDRQFLIPIIGKMDLKKILVLPLAMDEELFGVFTLFFVDDGFIEFGNDNLMNIANVIAATIHNELSYSELEARKEEKEMLLKLIDTLIEVRDKEIFHQKFADEITKLIPGEYILVNVENENYNYYKTFCMLKDNLGQFKTISVNKGVLAAASLMKSELIKNGKMNFVEIMDKKFDQLCSNSIHLRQLKKKRQISALLVLTYSKHDGAINLVIGRKNSPDLLRREKDKRVDYKNIDSVMFFESEILLGLNILPQLVLVYMNFLIFEEVDSLKKKLEQEKNYLLEEINQTNSFQEMIGNSPGILMVSNKVKQVAPLDATVLIMGETGTGKELVARAVHNLSHRKDNAFITINCAALPMHIIESELFGHEKGSFTGAIEKKIGKFEIADGGTVFLDEIGELPLEIQAKLLRVLQEKEFERVGGKSTIYSDVRIVAATNRNLEKEVSLGRFRSDLFFRLNVFPIIVPPLRERTEDIPLLVKHFLDKYSKKIGKTVSLIKKNDLDMFIRYNWPGNIRELEHLIERTIIISQGENLYFDTLILGQDTKIEQDLESFKTLVDVEKEHIIAALKLSKGKVSGDRSAAQILGLNGKTLSSKMRKLGITRGFTITTK